jgi:hypothetical protein
VVAPATVLLPDNQRPCFQGLLLWAALGLNKPGSEGLHAHRTLHGQTCASESGEFFGSFGVLTLTDPHPLHAASWRLRCGRRIARGRCSAQQWMVRVSRRCRLPLCSISTPCDVAANSACRSMAVELGPLIRRTAAGSQAAAARSQRRPQSRSSLACFRVLSPPPRRFAGRRHKGGPARSVSRSGRRRIGRGRP